MEKETVLEVEFKEVWNNKFAWRVTKNTLYEIETSIQRGYGNYTSINLDTEDDCLINTNQIINEHIKNKLEKFVEQINEKYGTLKIWRAEKGGRYYFVDNILETDDTIDKQYDFDNNLYSNGNYFKTLEEAEKYAKYIKNCTLKWHEKRGDYNE